MMPRDEVKIALDARTHTSAEFASLRAEVARLREALRSVLIGGNHLATIIGDHPPHTASHDEALEHYGAGDAYEAWCCWRAIMNARSALSQEPGR